MPKPPDAFTAAVKLPADVVGNDAPIVEPRGLNATACGARAAVRGLTGAAAKVLAPRLSPAKAICRRSEKVREKHGDQVISINCVATDPLGGWVSIDL